MILKLVILISLSFTVISCYSPEDSSNISVYSAQVAPPKEPEQMVMKAQMVPKKHLKRVVTPRVESHASEPIPVHARHPDHFYRGIPATVSITFGDALVKKVGTLEQTDLIPQAVAYSIVLQGDPVDQFIITPQQQVIEAPTAGIPSSTAYFSVTPLSRGQKKLTYFVKAQLELNTPGIGLPELHRDILVEVNKQSVYVSIKTFLREHSGKFLSAVGAAVGAWLVVLLKKLWNKKKSFTRGN